MGLCFKIVTSSKSADDVIRRIEQFLIDFRNDLPKMTNEAFMESLVGLSNNKLQNLIHSKKNLLSSGLRSLNVVTIGMFTETRWYPFVQYKKMISSRHTTNGYVLKGKDVVN